MKFDNLRKMNRAVGEVLKLLWVNGGNFINLPEFERMSRSGVQLLVHVNLENAGILGQNYMKTEILRGSTGNLDLITLP